MEISYFWTIDNESNLYISSVLISDDISNQSWSNM
jgi:hypothetical protein